MASAGWGPWSVPGYTAVRTTAEKDINWGPDAGRGVILYANAVLDTGCVDAGNSPTTLLRPGLVLGVITATGKYTAYVATNTDGSQQAVGVLSTEVNMIDFSTNAATNRYVPVQVAAPLKASELSGLDMLARAGLVKCTFDDNYYSNHSFPYRVEVAQTANYTVVAADQNTLFTTTGASGEVDFTLPASPAAGMRFRFLNTVDQIMKVIGSTDIVVDGNAGATTLSFQTASHKIGGYVEVTRNAANTKWYAAILSGPGNTVTIS